ncbi:phosphoenolpyruvate carboxykinase domain-containing protein [Arthrobacter sp. 9V]|uniref:phosphoenolpyruvate carboxykinase domain-containing protein n=1 Tax=Arthrobacter sp. 9V TaxID=2653132 RepID=UPI001F22B78E|nr:phosphoenolpyruvate carboxykinase domain-containing protein [Arthrobacter sp. 9V]
MDGALQVTPLNPQELSGPASAEEVTVDALLWAGYVHPERPSILEAFSWEHGLFVAASTAPWPAVTSCECQPHRSSREPETNSWQQWISFGSELRRRRIVPTVFQINLFRRSPHGELSWPPSTHHLDAFEWFLDRMTLGATGITTPLGKVPPPALRTRSQGAGIRRQRSFVNTEFWLQEAMQIESIFRDLGADVPDEMWGQLETLKEKIIYAI